VRIIYRAWGGRKIKGGDTLAWGTCKVEKTLKEGLPYQCQQQEGGGSKSTSPAITHWEVQGTVAGAVRREKGHQQLILGGVGGRKRGKKGEVILEPISTEQVCSTEK